MSIRLKILAGCLSLTLVTVLFGGFTLRSQRDLGTLATRIYDEAFMAVSYLRAAQNGLMKLSVTYANAEAERTANLGGAPDHDDASQLLAVAIPEILGDLQVAFDRAMSPKGQEAVSKLRQDINRLGEMPGAFSTGRLFTTLDTIQAEFDTAVEIYAGDGYRFRRSVGANIERSSLETWMAMGLSVLVALLITTLLSRSIVPAMHHAVRIAKAIASGQLDNTIDVRGSGETVQMLHALSIMQASIAANLARIGALMAQQASSHAGEIAIQNGRFEAALNNMTQGLCLFDEQGRLTVFNRRFSEMFGVPELGNRAEAMKVDEALKRLPGPGEGSLLSHDLPDGRVIAVSHEPTGDGGWVATYEDVTERRRVEAQFAHMARHDALTGLPNRVLFREQMEQLLARTRRGKGMAVLSLDLDGFKAVNDTLGHPMGDAVLIAVATRLRDATRELDVVARLGGDEFAVIQEDASEPDDVVALARRLVDVVSVPFEIEGHHVVIGASVGISTTLDVADYDSPNKADVLLKNADLALYRAKGDGRSTYRFFEAEMDARLQARRSLELDLRAALDKNQFELFYQPLVNTERGEVCGFEALLRWRHPQRGMVSPADFIPLAEEVGLIKAIGAWVLEQACAEAANWPGTIKVAVNLSPVQFQNTDLVAVVSRALITSGLAASRLELEITESLLLQDNGSVMTTLHRLRQLGISISMDDFGTGYSSLSYLQRFPFDKIKIDQSFIRNLSTKPDSVAIVRAVISLGRSLGIAVIAEGVETAEQLDVLQVEGCWDVQGYLFSPPKPADQALGLIVSCKEARTLMHQQGQGVDVLSLAS